MIQISLCLELPTFFASWNAEWSTMGGLVLGMASTMVIPPASAAAVPDAKSSLWVAPGSRRWTWTSIKPGMRTTRDDEMQSMWVFTFGAPPTRLRAWY